MDFSNLSRSAQYAIIFVFAGAIAVLIKIASEAGESRVAGLVSMMPMKLLVAWAIIGAAAGSRGIADSTSGMFMGLGALLVAIGAVRLLSQYLDPGALILSGMSVWLGAALLMEWGVRRFAAAPDA